MLFSYSKFNLFYFPVTFLLLLLILFLRIYLNAYLNVPLHFDEAQYWSWSLSPAWGYFSKPPLLAWIISISNYTCGDSEFCIRLPVPILYFFATIFVYFSTRILTQNNFISSFSAIIFNLIPGITFSSFITTTDVPLILFSSIFIFLFLIIYKKNNPSYFHFFLLSIIFSLGFLSKYAMVYFLISLFSALVFFKNIRTKFFNSKGIVFLFTFFIFILPHLYWNFENGFVTINHTVHNANFKSINLNLKQPLLFIFSQFIVFGIYPLFLIIQKLFKHKQLNEEKKILLIFFFTPIIIISLLSLFSRANANWAAVGFPSGIVFLAIVINNKREIFKKYYLLFSQFSLSLVIILLILFGKSNVTPDPFAKQKHTKELALSIEQILSTTENVAFMADDREDFALMLYYVKNFKGKKAKWNGDIKIDDHYELTTNVNDLKGSNLLFLTRTSPTEEMIKRSSSQSLIEELNFVTGKRVRKYNLYLLTDWN